MSMPQSPQVLGGCNKCNVSTPAACALGVGRGGVQNVSVYLNLFASTGWPAGWPSAGEGPYVDGG